MPAITEQDVISFLKEKTTRLRAELETTKAILSLLGQPDTLIPPRKTASKAPEATIALHPAIEKAKRGRKRKPATLVAVVPLEYSNNLTMYEKITYALSKTGPGFREDVFKLLNDYAPDADPIKLERNIMVALSAMYNKGLIQAVKDGRRSKYSLIGPA